MVRPPDGVHAPVDCLVLLRCGWLVAGFPGEGLQAGIHERGTGDGERHLRHVYLQHLDAGALPSGVPGPYGGHRGVWCEKRYRAVQQNLHTHPVCAHSGDCRVFRFPAGRQGGHLLPYAPGLLQGDGANLCERPGAGFLFPFAGHGYHHHLLLVCEQGREPSGERRGHFRERPALCLHRRLCHPPGRICRRDRPGNRPRFGVRHAALYFLQHGRPDARCQRHRRHSLLCGYSGGGAHIVRLAHRGGRCVSY